MPHYDYQCQECGLVIEQFQGMSETPSLECPECNSQGFTRLFGTGMVMQKGSLKSDMAADKAKGKASGGSCAHNGCGCFGQRYANEYFANPSATP